MTALPAITLSVLASHTSAPAGAFDAPAALVRRYLGAVQHRQFAEAFEVLARSGQTYYRNAGNLASIYSADDYRLERFALLDVRTSDAGRLYFVRETATFRDFAHDADLNVSATVPVGVVREAAGWRIKDPGHPWRAFRTGATGTARGLTIHVKKLSYFSRRVEVVATFMNAASTFVTVLPYGKTVLRDSQGVRYRIVETRNWTLTDRTLFEGLRLAPGAQYTGTLNFASPALADRARMFVLDVAPLIADGAATPESIEVGGIVDRLADQVR